MVHDLILLQQSERPFLDASDTTDLNEARHGNSTKQKQFRANRNAAQDRPETDFISENRNGKWFPKVRKTEFLDGPGASIFYFMKSSSVSAEHDSLQGLIDRIFWRIDEFLGFLLIVNHRCKRMNLNKGMIKLQGIDKKMNTKIDK